MSNITGVIGYWLVKCNSLTEIIAYNVTLKGASSPFHSCYYLERIEGLNTWDTSQVTDMSNFFNGCSSLTEIDVSSFDTSNVTNMEAMFRNYGFVVPASKLKRIKGIENFDMSKVTSMKIMFQGHNLLTELNISGWNVSKVTNMEACFADTGIKRLDLSTWDLRYLEIMTGCFSNCSELEEIIFPETHLVTCADGNSKRLVVQQLVQVANKLKKLDLSMIYGQAYGTERLMNGVNSIEEFYMQNLTVLTNNLGYFIVGGSNTLTKFKFFKSLKWENADGVDIFQNFGLSSYTLISKESLLSFLNALPDITSLTTNVYTLKIGAANMAKLTEDEIAAFTNKGYSLT